MLSGRTTSISGPATSGMLSHSTVMSIAPETMVGTVVSSCRVTVNTSEIESDRIFSRTRERCRTNRSSSHSLSLPEHSPKLDHDVTHEGELNSHVH